MTDEEQKESESADEATVTTETHEETSVQEEESKDTASEADIDFEKELERIEVKPQRTPEEIAAYNARKAIEKAKAMGVDTSKLVEVEHSEEDVDKLLDKKLAEREVRGMVKTDAEYKVVMHYVNKGLSVDDAYILAHKGRLKQLGEEIERSKVKISGGSPSGQRQKQVRVPTMNEKSAAELTRQGFKKNTDGSWEGNHIKLQPAGDGFREMRRNPRNKEEWIPVQSAAEFEGVQ
jgi:hypothetical protein